MRNARKASCTPCPERRDSTSGVFLQAFFSLALCVLIASGVSASAFDSATISGLSVKSLSVGFQLAAYGLVGFAGVLDGAVDQMQQHVATLGMAEETVAQSHPFVRALDQAGQVGEHEFALVDAHHAELRMQRGERIIGDLRLGRADRGEESGLAGIGQADQAGVGNQFQPQADGRSSPGWPGLAWRGARLVDDLKCALPKPPLPPW